MPPAISYADSVNPKAANRKRPGDFAGKDREDPAKDDDQPGFRISRRSDSISSKPSVNATKNGVALNGSTIANMLTATATKNPEIAHSTRAVSRRRGRAELSALTRRKRLWGRARSPSGPLWPPTRASAGTSGNLERVIAANRLNPGRNRLDLPGGYRVVNRSFLNAGYLPPRTRHYKGYRIYAYIALARLFAELEPRSAPTRSDGEGRFGPRPIFGAGVEGGDTPCDPDPTPT